ncbi:SID1 transmembrane family member 1-like isoform X1 [Watersipora subatra]|uniref:SID1 transmembrane family member 1-like isoform X1 n=2 Tax=Watersipora subatra TaxID=2589382 RepID=UPI00355C4252
MRSDVLYPIVVVTQLIALVAPNHNFKAKTDIVDGEFGTLYNVTVNNNTSYDIEFLHPHTENSVVRLTTSVVEDEADVENPLQIVVRQQLIVQSWNLPLVMNHRRPTKKGEKTPRTMFNSVSKTLCSAGQEVNSTLPVTVEVTTFSVADVEMHILAEVLLNFTVSIGPHYNIFVTPSSPAYYEYRFDKENLMPVTLYINSPQNYYCSKVSVQPAECPVEDIGEVTSDKVISQTFLKSAAVTINYMLSYDAVFIIFTVAPSDISCAGIARILPIGEPKLKEVEFWIEAHVEGSVYTYAILAALGYSFFFYLSAALVGLFMHLRAKRRNQQTETFDSLNDDGADEIGVVSVRSGPMAVINRSDEDDDQNNSEDLSEIDTLQDAEENKDVYRLKSNLKLADMCKKSNSKLRKKYALYKWNIAIVSIFYGLPVIQLVLTYQQYLNSSGDEDICYYNFQCARKLGPFYAFNNVFSNISYVLLGILFNLIVYLRKRQHYKLPKAQREAYGIPQFYGLPYAMGWALGMEGIMSACYHVCPSSNNFQFDTAFMYVLGAMITIRLFQSRHPDITSKAEFAFLFLGGVILVTVLGVLFNTLAVWIPFFFLHILVILYLTLKIYYAGNLKLDGSIIQSLRHYYVSECGKCNPPTFKMRFGLLAAINLINLGVALYGVIKRPSDFATFMLAVIVVNMMFYCFLYICLKCKYKEGVPVISSLLLVAGIGFTCVALYLFAQHLTDWIETPALSRNLNKDCVILDFYDTHDAWHFLSAGAIFCIFLAVLFIDDNLQKKPIKNIDVF